jgi:hypothetical protein
MEIAFTVVGVPPRKDLAWSLWSEEGGQRPVVLKLRLAARAAMGDHGPLVGPITLRVEVHVPAAHLMTVGDLDNYVSGICDGLQRASGKWADATLPEPEWAGIQPCEACAIENDASVVSICARKLPDADKGTWYRVVLAQGAPQE